MNIFNIGNKEDTYKAAPIPERLRKNKKIAILTDEGTEDLEFFYPYYRFHEAGYDVDVITSSGGDFDGKHGIGLEESKAITEVKSEDYVLLYLPGGKAPAKLRENDDVLQFVRSFISAGKHIAAICHGAQILISADLVRGKQISAWPGIKEELEKAGGIFADEALQEDGPFITARKPGDLHRHLYGVLQLLEGKTL